MSMSSFACLLLWPPKLLLMVQSISAALRARGCVQNRLTELWSLFDFVFPGKLGTLPVFQVEPQHLALEGL